MEDNNGVIIFDEELYKLNLEENNFDKEGEQVGPSPEDLEQLKKDGLL